MLIAVGQLRMSQLLEDFKRISQNKNEKHEYNENKPDFIHADGWGIVLERSERIELYKKDVACWKDPKFSEYAIVSADLVVLHARRASEGSQINYSFTHPFQRENWYFCHNGTVYDFDTEEKSDSEQFFTLLLDAIHAETDVKDAVRKTANEMKRYSALNFILTDGKRAYILNKHRKDKNGIEHPKYYTMKYLKDEKCVIVSSEVLPTFRGNWKQINNDKLIELDFDNLEMTIQDA
jgi:glutamine amidotransferase